MTTRLQHNRHVIGLLVTPTYSQAAPPTRLGIHSSCRQPSLSLPPLLIVSLTRVLVAKWSTQCVRSSGFKAGPSLLACFTQLIRPPSRTPMLTCVDCEVVHTAREVGLIGCPLHARQALADHAVRRLAVLLPGHDLGRHLNSQGGGGVIILYAASPYSLRLPGHDDLGGNLCNDGAGWR